MVWEVDAISAKTNSTTQDSSLTARVQLTGCEEKRLEAMTVRRLAARDLEQVVRTNLERLEPLLFRTQLN